MWFALSSLGSTENNAVPKKLKYLIGLDSADRENRNDTFASLFVPLCTHFQKWKQRTACCQPFELFVFPEQKADSEARRLPFQPTPTIPASISTGESLTSTSWSLIQYTFIRGGCEICPETLARLPRCRHRCCRSPYDRVTPRG